MQGDCRGAPVRRPQGPRPCFAWVSTGGKGHSVPLSQRWWSSCCPLPASPTTTYLQNTAPAHQQPRSKSLERMGHKTSQPDHAQLLLPCGKATSGCAFMLSSMWLTSLSLLCPLGSEEGLTGLGDRPSQPWALAVHLGLPGAPAAESLMACCGASPIYFSLEFPEHQTVHRATCDLP